MIMDQRRRQILSSRHIYIYIPAREAPQMGSSFFQFPSLEVTLPFDPTPARISLLSPLSFIGFKSHEVLTTTISPSQYDNFKSITLIPKYLVTKYFYLRERTIEKENMYVYMLC